MLDVMRNTLFLAGMAAHCPSSESIDYGSDFSLDVHLWLGLHNVHETLMLRRRAVDDR